MFFLCTFLRPSTLEQIDKLRKHCLWRGVDINAKSNPKVAWPMICLPKKEGGLGVLNLYSQNEALLLKYLNTFFNKMEIPWVHLVWEKHYNHGKLPGHVKKGSFWWKDVLKLLYKFKGLAAVNINGGSSCLLWEDLWLGKKLLPNFKPWKMTSNRLLWWILLTVGLLSGEMESFLLPLPICTCPDIGMFILRLNGYGRARQPKHKVYFWLLLKDRLSTRDLLRRKTMQLPTYECVLCSNRVDESVQHLFLSCSFSQLVWQSKHSLQWPRGL
ncbi:hypothetical protein U9M48_024674 [Paspalum notatum var. saurae]|uniref:Reverse transcriptase zinc-binding domain-containing protein n=1 Tax=Paspalum notatum var. saurae TaxID=547442 RepID=A0AAQ3WWB7_PASNO